MTIAQAVVLAVIQGVTEFLPISSSAHLILVPWLVGWRDQGLPFDILTNAGTLTAVLVYFRRDLREVLRETLGGSWRRPDGGPSLGSALALGTVPVVIAGLALYDWVSSGARSPLLIAATSIGFGLLLWAADRFADRTYDPRSGLDSLRWMDVVWIGLAEAVALVPGTSRSGATITAALFLGLGREAAARFSFLLAVPVGVAALVVDLRELLAHGPGEGGWTPLVVGYLVAAVAAWLVIDWLLAWLRRRDMTIFVAYRLILGFVLLGRIAWVA